MCIRDRFRRYASFALSKLDAVSYSTEPLPPKSTAFTELLVKPVWSVVKLTWKYSSPVPVNVPIPPAYLEIRAGAGGDEAAIFAADLFRMYSRLSERQGWKLEIVNSKQSEPSGLKEVVVKINGQGVFKFLKFESGVHRVQRVPETESQGRIHTSTVTVAILPEVDEVQDIEIDKSELRVDTYRASGAGGQHVNKTDSAVRLTHIPSGVVVECQDDRSQHKNKAKAMALLAAKLKQNEIDEQQTTIASERKILVGTGDRSEKIRTYNFPQGRITDHRIKLTQHNLDQVMDGDMISICQALITENQLAQLSNLEDSS